MIQIDSIDGLRTIIHAAKEKNKTVALVPTMGYLHEGHLRLVDTAHGEADLVIVSIFVNPLQFGRGEDLEQYPRDLGRDTDLLQQHGCDILFAPTASEMYPQSVQTIVQLPEMSHQLCGKTRPTHFQGVATVVSKLFNIVTPDLAYFGQKDGQQAAIIRRMVQDLNMPVEIRTVPIVRENDGLAMSSRNIYLTETERPHATVLYRALQAATAQILSGERAAGTVIRHMAEMINNEPHVRLDYADVVRADDLQPITALSGQIMIAVAAYVGKARLIDNVQLLIFGEQVKVQ